MNVVKFDDEKYPEILKDITKPPKRLYYKGEWDPSLFDKCLAVVGSRRMTKYGEKVTRELVFELAGAGITIVSGFMYGIDATAHAAALDAGGRTIAVMPCGIDLVIPEYQQSLYDRVLAEGGLVLSEYESDMPPSVWTFPARNRIVAGLSSAVLVVEGALNSGSLITAGLGKKFGREVFAVPGNITSPMSAGTLSLLKEEASLVTCAQDISNAFDLDLEKTRIAQTVEDENVVIGSIMKLLITSSKSLDEIVDNLGISSSEVLSELSKLEIRGVVSSDSGSYYVN